MKFIETSIQGAFIVELEKHSDERGFFARAFCAREFEARGLNPVVAQCNISFNNHAGTLRGLHFQVPPAAETKLVRCVRGAIYDVILDLREHSPTYLSHVAVELTADNGLALYIPEMVAHGFQTLADDTEVFYQMGAFYSPEHARGVRYDDAAFGIQWPLPVTAISDKDRTWPLFEGALPGRR